MSVVDHPIWRKISGYLKIDICEDSPGGILDPRIRIGFVDLPDELSMEAQFVEIRCVECQRPNHPLRRRKGDPHSRLYYAPACLMAIRIECSRGPAVRLEYEAFRDIGKRLALDPRQLSMF